MSTRRPPCEGAAGRGPGYFQGIAHRRAPLTRIEYHELDPHA